MAGSCDIKDGMARSRRGHLRPGGGVRARSAVASKLRHRDGARVRQAGSDSGVCGALPEGRRAAGRLRAPGRREPACCRAPQLEMASGRMQAARSPAAPICCCTLRVPGDGTALSVPRDLPPTDRRAVEAPTFLTRMSRQANPTVKPAIGLFQRFTSGARQSTTDGFELPRERRLAAPPETIMLRWIGVSPTSPLGRGLGFCLRSRWSMLQIPRCFT